MIQGTGKSEATYEQLEKEVIRVLQSLELKNQFGLVVFSQDARIFKPRLVKATSDEKNAAIQWLKKHNPDVIHDPRAKDEEKQFHHGTRADRGLEEAFALRPDVVFFVSDGEPSGTTPQRVLAQVEATQQGRAIPASVHSIAYLADGGQKFMRELAERNGGSFREVNPSDLK
jgi:hypothetical protein